MSKRVLVVDDELHGRELCCEFLESDGYVLESAEDGRKALDLLTAKPFDILLTDIQMPEMDGVTLLKEAKKLNPSMEVILMTAYAGLPSAIEAIRFGAYDYLMKPFNREFLLNTIRRASEKIDLQDKLGESQKKLVEQEKLAALGAVAGWLSHRMRNALSVISMCAHYLNGKKVDPASEDFKQVVTAVIEKTKSLEKMTADFITYSKPYQLQKCPGSVNAILDDVLESLSVQIQIQKVRLDRRLDAALPEILCDPHTLQEAFENIVVNALQAIGSQEGQSLSVSSERLPGNGPIRICIANTGSLIAQEGYDKIFIPFFTTKENGSGLGLAIVKKVVEQHGGSVVAESAVVDGVKRTTICVTLPAAEGAKGGG
jgi:signal transduction histidine kinase